MINNTVVFQKYDNKAYAVAKISGGDIGTISCANNEGGLYTYQPNLYYKYTNSELLEISEFVEKLNKKG